MPRILVATSEGLHRFDERGSRRTLQHPGRDVTALARDRDDLWSVIEGSELWYAAGSEEWAHVADLAGHRATCLAVTDGVLVGSSEARLFRLDGDGLPQSSPSIARRAARAGIRRGAARLTHDRSPSGAGAST